MRKIFTIAILALSINAFTQIPTNGLIGYWPFNGNANDESGFNNNGTVNGASLTTDRYGKPDNAYSFDGLNDYISILHNPIFNTDKFTISLWAKIGSCVTSTPTPDLFMITKEQWRIYHQGYYTPVEDSVSLIADIFTSNGRYVAGDIIKINNWCNIVFINDGLNLKLYYNNNLVSTTPIIGVINNTLENIIIGARNQGNEGFFVGQIDDIRLYNRDLSDSEVTSLFNEGLCFETITVTDTLIINVSLTGFNPVTYANTIKVYPNPTSDKITIDCGNNYSTLNGYTIKIANSLSQTVYTSLVTQQMTTIDLNSWTGTGIYFVHLIDASNNTIDIKKIVLQ